MSNTNNTNRDIYKNACRYDMLLHDDIERLLQKTLMHLKSLQAELRNSQGGTLYIKQSKSHIIFTEYFNGKEHGIGRNIHRIHKLARRKYISLLVKSLESSYKELQKLYMKITNIEKKFDPDPLLKTYKSLGLNLTNILYSPRQQKWLNQTFRKSQLYPESLEYISSAGIRTRSKSEKLIASRLEFWNVTFLYEFPLVLDGKTYYPDFTILKDNGEIIYWEHFGMMSDEDYFWKNSKKHREYRRNGLCDHTNLIITWEEDLLDMNVIDHIIKTRICN